jgi:hypothetical protein
VSDIHRIPETWDVQGGGFSKISIDWRRIPQRKHLNSWFCTCQDEYRTSASHNIYKAITMTTQQQRGIAFFFSGRNSGNTSYLAWEISEALADGILGSFKLTPAT